MWTGLVRADKPTKVPVASSNRMRPYPRGLSIEDSTGVCNYLCKQDSRNRRAPRRVASRDDLRPDREIAADIGGTKVLQGSTWLPATNSKSVAIVDLSMKMIPQNMVGVVAQGAGPGARGRAEDSSG
jgi:hypothetical protein